MYLKNLQNNAMKKNDIITEFKRCFNKTNLVTKTSGGQFFDCYSCPCGIECRRYGISDALVVTKVPKDAVCQKEESPIIQSEFIPCQIIVTRAFYFGSSLVKGAIIEINKGDVFITIPTPPNRKNGTWIKYEATGDVIMLLANEFIAKSN
jgi:hypothetical protein